MPEFSDSDESLLQAVGSGDLEAFEEIVRRHPEWTWQIAFRFFGRKEPAAAAARSALDALHPNQLDIESFQ